MEVMLTTSATASQVAPKSVSTQAVVLTIVETTTRRDVSSREIPDRKRALAIIRTIGKRYDAHATVTGAAPFDFGPEIALYSARFPGREWLEQEIGKLAGLTPVTAVVIAGNRGIGKSAIAACLAKKRPDVAAV